MVWTVWFINLRRRGGGCVFGKSHLAFSLVKLIVCMPAPLQTSGHPRTNSWLKVGRTGGCTDRGTIWSYGVHLGPNKLPLKYIYFTILAQMSIMVGTYVCLFRYQPLILFAIQFLFLYQMVRINLPRMSREIFSKQDLQHWLLE